MSLTEEEVQLYDRQIRLWGLEAQQRISTSCVLVLHLSPIHAEVCKDLAAAGVSLVLADDLPYSELRSPLSLPADIDEENHPDDSVATVYAKRLRRMNGYIKVEVIDEESVKQRIAQGISAVIIPLGEKTIECVLDLDLHVNALAPTPLVAYSYSPEDFALVFFTNSHSTFHQMSLRAALEEEHTAVEDSSPPGSKWAASQMERCVSELREGMVKRHSSAISVAAIMGGMIAQKVRKFISGEEESDPWNLCVFNPDNSAVAVASVGGEGVPRFGGVPDKADITAISDSE